MKQGINKKELLKQLQLQQLELDKKRAIYREQNPIEFLTTPPSPGFNPKQAQILEAFPDPFYKTFGMSGGNRLGKTFLLTNLGISIIIGKFPWDGTPLQQLFIHNKPRKIRYIGQGWNDHIQGVVIPELYKWWPKNRPVERRGNGVITDTLWVDVLTGGSIEIMSNTQKAKVHEGWSGDAILYDEPPRREIYIANARGLVDRRGREIFAATLLDEPWIDREIVKKIDKETGKPDKTVFWIEGESYDNVGFGITEEGIKEFSSKLTEEEIQVRIYGKPQYMQGLVYPHFSRKIHLFEWFQIPLTWIVDIAIDIHPREKQAVLFVATDPRQDRYICEEIWENGDGTAVGEMIIRKINHHNFRVNKIIIDPLSKGDKNNDNTVFDKIFAVLSRYGYTLQVASKDKSTGILEVKKHLKGPNNLPSLFLLDNCIRTLYEIEGYMWDKDTSKPMDKDDHMMENLYRIILLNTKYVEPEEEEFDHVEYGQNRNSITGY